MSTSLPRQLLLVHWSINSLHPPIWYRWNHSQFFKITKGEGEAKRTATGIINLICKIKTQAIDSQRNLHYDMWHSHQFGTWEQQMGICCCCCVMQRQTLFSLRSPFNNSKMQTNRNISTVSALPVKRISKVEWAIQTVLGKFWMVKIIIVWFSLNDNDNKKKEKKRKTLNIWIPN